MSLNSDRFFAAFVMTYRRSEILEQTIVKLFSQTYPPQKILIVDNDPLRSAETVQKKFPEKSVSYHAVGYNAGPAGAAYYGLKILAEDGWGWIMWVDDDDPPVLNNQLERVLSIRSRFADTGKIGIIGSLGSKFDIRKLKVVRLRDEELSGIIEVDMITGGHAPIINRAVVDAGVLPDKDLFFGFEELEFCLRVKDAGFKLLIDGYLHKELRVLKGRIGYKSPLYNKKPVNSLWREYYSTRTVLFLSKRKKTLNLFALFFLIKILVKSIYLFSYGFSYGMKNMKYTFRGYIDGMLGRMGMRIMPSPKT